MTEKLERQLPTGIGGEKLNEGKETLPAVEVANEVAWVNNKIEAPFKLEVGKQSRLGMFLTPNNEGENPYPVEVSKDQTRSGILGRVIFKDKEGRLYRDIDMKGIGYSRIGYVPSDRNEGGAGPLGWHSVYRHIWRWAGTTGIANQELIRRDVDFSEKFLKAGVRTHRVIAVIDLKEVVGRDGRKMSIKEAQKEGVLKENDEPVIEIRAFGVRSRLSDIDANFSKPAIQKRLLEDARTMVAQELGLDPDKFTDQEYIEWLVDTMAVNVARMHHKKWVHGYLTTHHITLDGRIVDLDSVENIKEHERRDLHRDEDRKSFIGDCDMAVNSLIRLQDVLYYYPHQSIHPRYWVQDSFSLAYKGESERLKNRKKEGAKKEIPKKNI